MHTEDFDHHHGRSSEEDDQSVQRCKSEGESSFVIEKMSEIGYFINLFVNRLFLERPRGERAMILRNS